MSGDARQFLTQKQYAERKGWSKQYVHQLVKQGRIPTFDGRIDPDLADAAIDLMRDPGRGPRSAPRPELPASVRRARLETDAHEPGEQAEDPADAAELADLAAAARSDPGSRAFRNIAKARAVREHYRALREKTEYQVSARELLSRAEVEAAAQDAGHRHRQATYALCRRLAEKYAVQLNVPEIELVQEITREANVVLTELAEDLRRSIEIWPGSNGATESTDEQP